jgi:PleD family two-component response regulator
VREIITNHSGFINVASQPNKGSVFEVWLPMRRPDDRLASVNRPATASGKGGTVLILDESRSRLLHDEELVAVLGYEPVGFSKLETAVVASRSGPQRFDASLIVRVAPLSRALAAARTLHAISGDLPILIVTPTGTLDADVLTQAGVREVLSVPLTSSDLALALRRHVTVIQTVT